MCRFLSQVLVELSSLLTQRESGTGERRDRREPHLVVFAVGVAAAVLVEDAALAIDDVALVALASLHAVEITVPLPAGRGALGLARRHAAGIVAVRRARQHWTTDRECMSVGHLIC